MNTITQSQYSAFQKAYDFFNDELFDGSLPQVMITMNRKSKSLGYFSSDKFTDRVEIKESIHELALNPDHFGRTERDILSTLVHEMCHCWQQCYGKMPRRAYHDKQWASKMITVGLYPSDSGQPGGKTTGQNMTHYVVDNGPYDQAFQKLQRSGFILNWQSRPDHKSDKKKAASKSKYTCPECEMNVWGKPELNIVCGDCQMPFQMEEKDSD